MKKLLLLIPVSSFFSAGAQITLGSSDFPSANDMFVMSDATPFPGMDETLTGANFTWDFSQLTTTTTGQHTDTLFPVTNMNIIYQAVFGDFNFLPHRSNQAIHAPDFTLGTQISISNAYNFYYNNSSDYHQSGFGAEINGIPAPTPYSPHDIIYKFPLQYGNVDSSASGYSVSLPNLLYYGVDRNRLNEVDGWGTLITPSGTYSVLRLKSTIQERDSIYLDTLGLGYGFNLPVQTEYKWLGQDGGVPLLQVNVAGGLVTSVTYKGLNLAGVNTLTLNNFNLDLFPNPAVGEIFLKYSIRESKDVNFTITDIEGTVISSMIKKDVSSGEHVSRFELPAGLARGNYLLKMTCGETITVKPFIVGN